MSLFAFFSSIRAESESYQDYFRSEDFAAIIEKARIAKSVADFNQIDDMLTKFYIKYNLYAADGIDFQEIANQIAIAKNRI